MRRHKRSVNMNLDSLMDTMTNVVGILIILLAVTQLTVGQTVRQFRFRTGSSGVSREEFEEAERELARLQGVRQDVEKQWAHYQSRIEQMGRSKKDYAKTVELDRRIKETGETLFPDRRTVEAEIASLERRIAGLKKEIAEKEEEIAARRSALAQAYKKGPVMTDINVPVLTPAPSGQKPVYFICRGGRVYPFDPGSLGDRLERAAREVTGQRSGPINLGQGGSAKLEAYLNRHDVGDEYIRLRIKDLGLAAQLRYEPRRAAQGETLAQLSSLGSAYMRRLNSIDPDKQYLMFLAWADSFDVYEAARDAAKRVKERFSGSWIPYDIDEELTEILGVGSGGGSGGRALQW